MQGFDEYMNVVLDDAEEVNVKKRSRKPVGRILLKGDNITLISAAPEDGDAAVAASETAA
jgi:small nuclear ribonucleoprotein E